MNINIKVFLLCPIPEDQKPINVYIELKEDSLTNWTTFSKLKYEQKLISLAFSYFLPLSLCRLPWLQNNDYFLEWTLLNCLITSLLLIFLLCIILSRWKQLDNEFNQPRLFYEEGSWYDGQVWEKPLSILKNDKLISSQKIQPILQRLIRTLFTLVSISLTFLFLLEIQ